MTGNDDDIHENIYINENLNKDTQELFYETRQMKKKGYKHVWEKNRMIFLRKTDTSKIYRIDNKDQLQQIINEHNNENDLNAEPNKMDVKMKDDGDDDDERL